MRAKGTPKTGGRQKGTPNKVTGSVREWIADIIDKNREQMEQDIKDLEPKERLMFLEKLLQYIAPKRQAVNTTPTKDDPFGLFTD